MKDRNAYQPRRGFTMLVAITLLAMASVAIVLLTRLASEDIRRTQREVGEAQLRVLLESGFQAAASELNRSGTLHTATLSPPVEAGDEASLTIDIGKNPGDDSGEGSAERKTATITAMLGHQSMRQTVTFVHQGSTWATESAELNPPSP